MYCVQCFLITINNNRFFYLSNLFFDVWDFLPLQEWDMELATFAQIWANQCTLNHDLCRATSECNKFYIS